MRLAAAAALVMSISGCALRNSTTLPPAVLVHTANCSAGLAVSVGPSLSERTQQQTVLFAIRNTGRSACNLSGYPQIAMRGAAGAVLPFTYRSGGDQTLTGAPPTEVRLEAGGLAYFAINKNSCVARDTGGVTRVDVTLPGITPTVGVNLTPRDRHPRLCPGPAGRIVGISPVETRVRATLR